MLVQGRNLIVTVGGVAIACARSCELSIDVDTTEVSNPTSGQWKRYLAGRKGWSVSVSALTAVRALAATTGSENLSEALSLVGTEALLSFSMKTSDGVYSEFNGVAICTGSKITGTIGNLSQGSWTFQGNGELYENTATTINCKGILSFATGGSETGYYLTYTTSGGDLNKLVLNDISGDTLVQYTLRPNSTTTYNVVDDSGFSVAYHWDGSAFVLGKAS